MEVHDFDLIRLQIGSKILFKASGGLTSDLVVSENNRNTRVNTCSDPLVSLSRFLSL